MLNMNALPQRILPNTINTAKTVPVKDSSVKICPVLKTLNIPRYTIANKLKISDKEIASQGEANGIFNVWLFECVFILSENDGATAAAGAKAAPPKDPLPKVPCLEALAELRHAKWFQVCFVSLRPEDYCHSLSQLIFVGGRV